MTTTTNPTVTEIADHDTDPETVAHIVAPASAVTEAYITGRPVRALCGHVFIPTRDPHAKPKCRPCCDVLDEIMAARGRLTP